jgi:hypothetical protein
MAIRSLRSIARRLRPLDRVALGLAALYALVWIVRATGHEPPLSGLVAFFCYLSVGYALIRIGGWTRNQLLWSLRNRLIIAYLFIAVVPVVMLLVLGGLSADILYRQLGGYLLVEDFQDRIEEVADAADVVASATAAFDPTVLSASRNTKSFPASLETQIATLEDKVPQIEFNLHADGKLLQQPSAKATGRFSGLVQTGDALWIVGEVRRNQSVVMARVPVTSSLLERVATFMGPIQVIRTQPASSSDPPESILPIGSGYRSYERVGTQKRKASPASAWYDFQVDGISKIDALLENSKTHVITTSPVFVTYTARVASLNSHLFTSLGDLGNIYIQLFFAMLLVFIFFEACSLVTCVVLTGTVGSSK